MGNVFDYIKNFVNNYSDGTYGDLITNQSTEDKIESMLEGQNKEIYLQIKTFDRNRMLQDNINLQNIANRQINNGTYTSISGIGVVQQMC